MRFNISIYLFINKFVLFFYTNYIVGSFIPSSTLTYTFTVRYWKRTYSISKFNTVSYGDTLFWLRGLCSFDLVTKGFINEKFLLVLHCFKCRQFRIRKTYGDLVIGSENFIHDDMMIWWKIYVLRAAL